MINISMPQYDEGLADSLKAQVDLLRGSGEFAGYGTLQNLLETYERPLRMSQAQTDTDVLRQTLLGDRIPITRSEQIRRDNLAAADMSNAGSPFSSIMQGPTIPPDILQRNLQQQAQAQSTGPMPVPGQTTGERRSGATTQIDYGGQIEPETGRVIIGENPVNEELKNIQVQYNELKRQGKIIDAVAFAANSILGSNAKERAEIAEKFGIEIKDKKAENALADAFYKGYSAGDTSQIDAIFDQYAQPTPAYKQNDDGSDFIVPKNDKGEFITESDSSEIPEGGTAVTTPTTPTTPATPPATPQEEIVGYERAGTGLIDLLGDRRMALDPSTGLESDRMSGFDSEGNFLGMAALAEDIGRGNLSRQREADLSDVERLSDRYQTVMSDFKPATTTGISGAKELIEEQKDKLTSGGGTITVPEGSTYGGDATAATMTGAKVADSPTLTAKTSFDAASVADPLKLSANTRFGGALSAGAGEDTLRNALLGDASSALGEGLTEREQRNIQEAFRARSNMMGRTFDQSAGIAEAEARVAEDNARRMQNRSFAQSVLGQEAGLQQGDISRGMAQESEQARLNQAKALADAQMLQQARAMGMDAGMRRDAQQAELNQQRNLTQAQLDQQASAFDAEAAMRTGLANQAQRQQANQFDVGAKLDAQSENERLRQAGLANYIGAVGNLASIEQTYGLDPFQDLLGRGGGNSFAQGQQAFGQAGYGLDSSSQFLNPEAGLGFISQMATNNANLSAANMTANALRDQGMFSAGGNIASTLFQTLIPGR